MIDLKPEILTALRGSAVITTLLGKDTKGFVKVYPETTPNEYVVPEPYITFFEITNFGSLHADDDERESSIHIQVDVWSKGNTSPIAIKVVEIMKTLDFSRTGGADQYESDTKTYHKILRFKTTREV